VSDTKLELFPLNYKHYVRIRGSVIISVREQKFQGMKVPGNEGSREQKFPGTKVLGYETSMNRNLHWQKLGASI